MKYTILKNVYIDKDEITEIKAIEHDTKTRFINFKFIGSNTVVDLSDCNVRVYAKNSRYIEIFNDLTVIDAKSGIAQLELTDKFLRLGITEYQLKIMPMGGGQLSSNTMKIIVSEDLMQGNSIESSNEYKAFENSLNKIDKYDLRLRAVEDNWEDGNVKTKDSVLFENATLRADETLIYKNNEVYDTGHKPTAQDIGASPSDHNHDNKYLKKKLGSTGESLKFETKYIEVGQDPNKLVEVGVGPNDTYIHNTKSDKYFALKDDGRIIYDNKKVLTDIQSTPLWQGYHHMSGKEKVIPSKKLSECNNGWVIVWSDWDDGTEGQNWNVVYSYIPKNSIFKNGNNHLFGMATSNTQWAIKALNIFDDHIQGDDVNKTGDAYDVVIRAVLEY
ncbi:BppU family phage baseplate upper protein [Clostridium baratii]|uniref:BppU family phage baseplate upper protein n=1 Tax=Clostridium baratii TaxID=1561 RepID=UPI0030CE4C35